MGRGLRLEDASRAKKMDFEQNLCCLLNCKAFGGSRVKAFGGSRVKTRRLYLGARRWILSKLVLFT